MGTRHLRRILRSVGLKRRKVHKENEVMEAINFELSGSWRTLGYRSMTHRLLTKHGIVVPRATVAEYQNLLDPEGVANRRLNRLSRRMYQNNGPNFLIHLDGYDKLKRFGFAIYGAICGFSRRMLWLKVTRTNNNPRIIAGYFMEYLAEIKDISCCGNVALTVGIVGGNPSIPAVFPDVFGVMQEQKMFWLRTFRNLSVGIMLTKWLENTVYWLDHLLPIRECLRFSFTKLIQKDLDECRQDWNQHRIRSTNNAECPGGKPDMMYFLPDLFDSYRQPKIMFLVEMEMFSTVDYKTDISPVDIDAVCEWCEFPRANGVQEGFENICTELMRQHAMNMPDDHNSALEVYQFLYQHL